MSTTSGLAQSPSRILPAVSLVLAAWLLSLGFDFFLHAGLLARLYARSSPFLLPAGEAFRRIPLGYGASLVGVLALWWLFVRLQVSGLRSGLVCGGVVGLVAWGVFALGLYSVSTAEPTLLVGWWIGQSTELALAGAVLGAGRDGTPLRRIWVVVAIAVVAQVAVTVLLQSIGLAPAVKLAQLGWSA